MVLRIKEKIKSGIQKRVKIRRPLSGHGGLSAAEKETKKSIIKIKLKIESTNGVLGFLFSFFFTIFFLTFPFLYLFAFD